MSAIRKLTCWAHVRSVSVAATMMLSFPYFADLQAAPLGPTPYLSSLDSPFQAGSFAYFHLENFEDGALNVPGVTVDDGPQILSGSPLTDSVDQDDGTLNGQGSQGHSLFSHTVTGSGLQQLVFRFDRGILGQLPSHVGLVFTDVGTAAPTNFAAPFTLEAFDAANVSLGTVGPITLGDGISAAGETAEDRFLGFSDLPGVAKLVMSATGSSDWEVDHLQYGLVPEPQALVSAAALCACAAVCFRRSSRK